MICSLKQDVVRPYKKRNIPFSPYDPNYQKFYYENFLKGNKKTCPREKSKVYTKTDIYNFGVKTRSLERQIKDCESYISIKKEELDKLKNSLANLNGFIATVKKGDFKIIESRNE